MGMRLAATLENIVVILALATMAQSVATATLTMARYILGRAIIRLMKNMGEDTEVPPILALTTGALATTEMEVEAHLITALAHPTRATLTTDPHGDTWKGIALVGKQDTLCPQKTVPT